MRTFVYRKLIRDKILDHMISQGEQPQYHILNDQDYLLEANPDRYPEIEGDSD